MKHEIVKVQRSLSAPHDPALLYAKDRRRLVTVPIPELPYWLQQTLIKEPKVYCLGNWTGADWNLKGIAPVTPDW